MKVIITGASGMVGKGVLLECLDHNDITEVLSLGRSKLDLTHPKLKQLIHKDFSDYSSIKSRLEGYDACFFAWELVQQVLAKSNTLRLLTTILWPWQKP